jgi:hypothetical protein
MNFVKKQIIRNDDGDPYMIRRAINTPLGGVKLHQFLRSDDDRDLHDHPWSFVSLILRGGYWEHTHAPCVAAKDGRHAGYYDTTLRVYRCGLRGCSLPQNEWPRERRWYGIGSLLVRPAHWTHRVELPEGKTSWSLVFTGPKRREWGFHTICGWIPWTRYWDAKREGC